MRNIRLLRLLPTCIVTVCLLIFSLNAGAQQQTEPAPLPAQQDQADDIVRITTQLNQTDVSVFDKQGRFVDGLKKEDFELRVDGKPVEVSFFERIAAGTINEDAQLAAARGSSTIKGSIAGARPLDRGRIVAFFIDDIHMTASNLKMAKGTIAKYIEREMGQNDLVAVTSASGQIGFLQQYTDNKEVLKAALARINYKNFSPTDMQQPTINHFQALQVDRGDFETLNYLIDETIRQNPGMSKALAEANVRERVSIILRLGGRNSTITLSSLESLVRSSAPLPGRKLVFLLSDGFFLDTRNGNMIERMRSIADASSRSGAVIYSMDARGLVTGMEDATASGSFDPYGRQARTSGGELSATQDVLNAIAVDTGGQFVRNTNALAPALKGALTETSIYYLLAWRPETESQRGGKFHRIEVVVKDRPELNVRVQRGFFDTATEQQQAKSSKKKKKGKAKKSADPLDKALTSRFPQRGLPTELSVSYMAAPNNGVTLVASMKIAGTSVKFEQAGNQPTANIDITGVIFDSQGTQLDGFRQRLIANRPAATVPDPRLPDINYNYYSSSTLKPGLYQVRVAARYEANGQTGSAMQWIEIPDLTKQRLSMSSLIVGERKLSVGQEKMDETVSGTVPLSVDRRFERSSNLRFLVYIYNAARGATTNAQPQVDLQIQILRDDQPVATSPLRKLSTDSQDLARLAYAAEIPLHTISSGRYVLQVTAIDRIAKTSASQRVRFEVQ